MNQDLRRPSSFLARATSICMLAGAGLVGCGDDGGPLNPDACGCIDASMSPDAAPATDAATASGWHPLADVVGGPVQETATVGIDGKIYVVGGFNENLAVVPHLRIYDTVTNTWRQGAPMLNALHHVNAAAVDGKLYVLGGMEGLSFNTVGTSYVYDPAANTWTPLPSMPAGTERGSSFVGVIGTKIYLAGGLRNGTVSDHSYYDTVANTWSALLPPLPTPRDHGVGAGVGTTFYAIGGRSGGITGLSGRVDRYETTNNTWSAGADMITPRGGTAAGIVNGRVIVVGGEGNPAASSGVFPQTEAYDPVGNTWESLAPMVSPRHGMGAAGWDGKLYVPGGADQQAFGAVATNEVYIPE